MRQTNDKLLLRVSVIHMALSSFLRIGSAVENARSGKNLCSGLCGQYYVLLRHTIYDHRYSTSVPSSRPQRLDFFAIIISRCALIRTRLSNPELRLVSNNVYTNSTHKSECVNQRSQNTHSQRSCTTNMQTFETAPKGWQTPMKVARVV